jgi:hypothetical protein
MVPQRQEPVVPLMLGTPPASWAGSWLTVAFPTPSTRFNAFAIRPTQEALVIPTTGSEPVPNLGVRLEAISASPVAWTLIVDSISEFCWNPSAVSSHWKVTTRFGANDAP